MVLLNRKANRLKNFDYSTDGYYFITICTNNKQKLLCDIVGDDAHIVPTKYGKIVEKYILSIKGIDKYVVMPNHIHLIIKNENGTMWASSPTVSQKIKSFKILTTKSIGKSIFQRSFYDHIIRDENDYLRIWEYIENNPLKWSEDKYYIE
ncbi:MAG: transposase [Clostridia bacterium]|nr:transposase [Clostridia bacterium]